MKIIRKLLGDGKQPRIRFDMDSWRNLEYNDLSIVLAKELIKYREHFNLTPKDLANVLGCTLGYLVKLESGTMDDISIRMLIEMWTRLSTLNMILEGNY